MKKRSFFRRILVFILAVAIGIVPSISHVGTISAEAKTAQNVVKAEAVPNSQTLGAGSIGTVVNSNDQSFVEKLPSTGNQGYTRFTTDTYNSNNAAIDTNDWGSNWLWDLEGDRYSAQTGTLTDETGALTGTAYAFPLSYLMKEDGLRVSKPSMTSNETNISAYYVKDVDTLGDFNIKPDWTSSLAEIDHATDWSYEGVIENPNNSSQSMRVTMTQGSPFAFVELTDSNVISLEKLRVTFPSNIVYSGTYDGCLMYVFECQDLVGCANNNGYPSTQYQYYAAYFPASTSVTDLGTTDETGNDGIGTLKFTLPSDSTYMTLAWLCEGKTEDDSTALSIAQEYRPYAFNFISDTKADYSYNESTNELSTTYSYAFDKKAESTADGTVMGILPHQYKNMSGYSYMSHEAITLRGYMKFLKGSSYTTTMEYDGILPFMPALPEDDATGTSTLQSYVSSWMDQYMSNPGSWVLANDEVDDTYYQGKKLNRSAQVLAAAKTLGDEEAAETILNALEAELEDWFTYSGSSDSTYFTYKGDGVGVLLGFPTSFNAADQFNDHHFHYGYFIEAAACVGLWDKAWLEEYKDVVKQLVYDIASPYRNQDDCVADCGNAYPYLRSFSPYEGHSWASGYADERTGNNQESTSEANNAWAGIILFGELIGDEEIRDLGIYLYATEIEAANNYWFDHDGDIYTVDDSNYDPPMASMVWGGKADYATWFGKKYTQGIQICPMQSWSFYLLQGGSDYIKNYYEYDKTSSLAEGGSTDEWNDMWAAYYALADPSAAMNSVWTKEAINDGESQAHTYHYIQSMIDYGTPDLTFTCNNPLASVFNKDGSYTYAVYNASNTSETVTFTASDGSTVDVVASPNAMTVFNAEDVGKAAYTIEYYAKDLSGDGYSLINSTVKYADADSTVTTTAKSITGYSYESENNNNVTSATVNANGSTTLKLYYTRNTYTVSYELNGGSKSDELLYPSSYTYGSAYTLDIPTKDGYKFMGWYLDSEFSEQLNSITARTYGNMTLYARWALSGTIFMNDSVYLEFDSDMNGTFHIIGDADYNAVNVLYKICDTESEASSEASNKTEEGYVAWGMTSNDSGWEYTQSFTADKGKYVVFYFIRYNENAGYKTSYAYGQIVGNGTTPENPPGGGTPGDDITWTVVSASNDQFYYGDASNISVVNVQQPGFATKSGIYMTTGSGVISYIKINGVTVGSESVAIQGAGAVVYLSALTSYISTVTYCDASGNELGSVKIKNVNGEEDTSESVSYTVEYYFQDTDFGGYTRKDSETIKASGKVDEEVSAEIKEYTGFTHDADINGTVLSGTLKAEGEALVLKVYYNRNTYDITYELDGGTNAPENKLTYVYGVGLTLAAPTKDGYEFGGWYRDAEFTQKITAIGTTETGVITVYAKWTDSEAGGGSGDYETPEGGGYTYENGAVIFNYTSAGATVYLATFDTLEAAQAAQKVGNDASGEGLTEIGAHVGYTLGGHAINNGNGADGYTASVSMTEGKYFVYGYAIPGIGITGWYVGCASTSQVGGEDPIVTAAYKVEHYKQVEKGSAEYELADTDEYTGQVGETATAVERTYDGYKQNTAHKDRVPTGIITQDGSLVLKLYYDISEGDTSGGTYPTPSNGGYTYDADTDKLTFYADGDDGGIVYVAFVDGESAAVSYAESLNNGGNISNIPGYMFSVLNNRLEYTHTSAVEEGTYFVYAFNADWTGTGSWYVGVAKTAQSGGGEGGEEDPKPDPVEVSYTVEHYQQNADLKGYTLKDAENGTGKEGDNVSATNKTYTGFTYNSGAAGTVASGKLVEGETLTLKLYYDRNKYAITYVLDGGTNATSNASQYVYGVGITFAEPTKDGYSFGGWYTDSAFHNPITAIGTDSTTDVTVYAKWIKIDNSVAYTVKYYQQNTTLDAYEEVASISLFGEAGDEVEATIESYKGFTHNASVAGTLLKGTLAKDTELVLKVYYDRNKYSITYMNMEDATNATSNVSEYVYGVGISFADPSRDGYAFAGWYTDAGFTNGITGIGTSEAEAITVYAKWVEITPDTAYYTVKYYVESLTEGKYMEVVADRVNGTGLVGDSVTAPEKTYEGYELNDEAEGTKLNGVLSAENLVLKLFYDRCEYNITYNNVEGAVNPDTNAPTYVYGKGFTLSEPTKTDYVFAGWYTDSEFAEDSKVTQISDSQTGDVELFAKWASEMTEYSVKYYMQNTTLNGYTEVPEKAFNRTAAVGLTVNALDEEYDISFDGFTLNTAGSILSGTVSKSEPLILKLYYDRNSYGITYENMDGATNATANKTQYVYGVGMTLGNPTKEDSVFLGWYLDEDFAEESKIAEISPSSIGAVTVYAKWMAEAQSAEYVVYYYFQDVSLDGYTENEKLRYTGYGEIGTVVNAPVKEVEGFVMNKNVAASATSGEITEGETLELRLYYDRASYTIKYNNMEDAENNTANKSFYVYGVGMKLADPERENYLFAGWYTNAEFTEDSKVTEIGTAQTGNINLYAKWDEYVPDVEEEIKPEYDFTVDTIADKYYTGSKIVPEIVVKDGDTVLMAKKDYTVKISNNKNAGTATVKITGKGNYGGTVEKQFKILPVDISENNENVSADDIFVAYKNGKNIKVSPKVLWGTKTLKLNKDYEIVGNSTYNNVGTYDVTLKGKGNYSGERTIQFQITNQVLMSKVKISSIPKQYYKDGEAITPVVTVKYKGDVLTEGHDYSVEYLNNTSAGKATVMVTGNGTTFVGERKITFQIVGTPLKTMSFELENTEFEYIGEEILPKYYSGKLEAGKDYTVSYAKNINVGKGTVTFTGINGYTGTVKKTFKITPYNIANNTRELFEDATGDISVEFVKGGNKPSVELYFNDALLKEGTDYTLKYKSNTKAGTGNVTITGKGKYTGKFSKDFVIEKNDMDNLILMPEDIVFKAGKKAKYYMAKLTVNDVDGKKLAAGKDYDKNNIVYEYTVDGVTKTFNKNSTIGELPVGTVLRVTITGINNYEGKASKEYKVVSANIKSAKFKIDTQAYTGEAITLEESDITLTIGGAPVTFEIVEDSYVNNVNKGTAKVTVRGTGNYGGYKTLTFKIGQKDVMEVITGIFRK